MFGRIKTGKRNEDRGFLARLGRDTRGNTLAMVAAAILPLLAMIGSGLDMSRAYMAQARLQTACDAASLAARRVMTNDTFSTAVRDEGLRFFNFNFEQGSHQTAAFTPVISRPDTGVVRVTASTTIPTSIMRIFGYDTLPLEVSCDASMNYINTDIVLVLDVTGSMMCTPPEGSNCYQAATRPSAERSGSKIVALRAAVMALYAELEPIQEQLEAQGQRLRFGIVPYSSTVNVGNLIADEDPDFIRASSDYQSRVANYTVEKYVQTGSSAVNETSTQNNNSSCNTWANNNGNNPVTTNIGPNRTIITYSKVSYNSRTDVCTRRKRTVNEVRRYELDENDPWTYRSTPMDTSALRSGNPVTVASSIGNEDAEPAGTVAVSGAYTEIQLGAPGFAPGISTTPMTWNGCIEERDTALVTDSTESIPAGAFDMDINRIPDSDATRWRANLLNLVWRRGGLAVSGSATDVNSGTNHGACPREAERLRAFSEGEMQDYVDSLVPNGYTYHDIGMIWGARFISSAGVFGDSPDVFNGMPTTRHIIYMTDGQIDTEAVAYTAWGIEDLDRRVANGDASDETSYHERRFRLLCSAAKNNGASIWVIAFGVSLSTELTNCATNADQASTSANQEELIERFRQIGQQIGALRLVE